MRRLHCDPIGWHVFARGTRRLLLFRDDADYETFLRFLGFSLFKSGCELWAYALMTNHYHLILYGSSEQLSRCMFFLNGLYSHYHNERYNLGGHVFEGPYKAYRSPTFRLLLWKVAYVFLNPVKGGLCDRPEEYRWSGYSSFLGVEGSPMEVQAASLMDRIDLPLERAWARFHECMRLELQRPSRPVQGRPTWAEAHMDTFDWLLLQARQAVDLPSGVDPLEVAVYWARKSGVAPRFIARSLGLTGSREIREKHARFAKRLANEPSLAYLANVP